MSKIPREKVDEVQAAADIVEVAAPYVGRLKRSGSRYLALCPFHDEKTPSFSLTPEKNLFYCFGCQKGGSVFTLVQEMEGVSFPEAVRLLAERFGVSLPEEEERSSEEAGRRESVYHALRFAARFFYQQLTRTDEGARALRYLQDERGLTPPTIKRFGLGYAPNRWDALLEAARKEQIGTEVLEEAGLVIARSGDEDSGYYDRYRGRVIFPIFSRVGRVLGFAGRILSAETNQPKYINSPETSVYRKSRVLYGLHQAKGAVRRAEEAVLVEGYTDVIALHQAGFEHAVATCGTALTAEQVQLLGRYADRLVLLYDADDAGARATVRGMERALEAGLAAYAVTLPEGDDPDTFVRSKGPEALRRHLRHARQDVAAFHRARAEREGCFDTSEDKTKVMHEVVAAIARIPNEIARENHLRQASETLDMYEEYLRKELQRELQQRQRREAYRRAPRPTPPSEAEGPVPAEASSVQPAGDAPSAEQTSPESIQAEPLPEERTLLRLMLERGAPMVELILGHMAMDEFTDGPPRRLAARLLAMYEEDDVDRQRVLDGAFGPELQDLAVSVLVDEHEPSQNWTRRQNIAVKRGEPYDEAVGAMKNLKLDRVEEAIERQRGRIYRATRENDDEALTALQEEMMALHELRRQIQQRAFLDWREEQPTARDEQQIGE